MNFEVTRWGASLRVLCWRLVVVWWPEPWAWLEQLRSPTVLEQVIIGLAGMIILLVVLFGR